MFYLLFYKQILHLKLIFGQNSQKRKNVLSSMVIGYYQNSPIFNWKQLYFQYFSFFQFFNSWFNCLKNYIHFYNVQSFFIDHSLIKKNLYLALLFKKKFQKQLIFFDLRLDFFFLLKDLSFNLDQLFIPLWFPGLISNFNGQSPLIKENFFNITKIIPNNFSQKLLIFFDSNHLKDMLQEIFFLFPYTHLNIISFDSTIQPLWFQENCLFTLSGNTNSFNCLYFYCSLFFYLFKGYISYLDSFYAWLQYYKFFDFNDDVDEIMPQFTRSLKYNFWNFFFSPKKPFYSLYEKNTKKRLPIVNVKIRRWNKFVYRYHKRLTKHLFSKWKYFKNRLRIRKKQKFFNYYDTFFFNCKKWYTPPEYYYRKIRSKLIYIKQKRKCLYWHHVLNKLSLKSWWVNYNKIFYLATDTNIASFVFKPYPIYLHSFAKLKFKNYIPFHKNKIKFFWRKRIQLLWWRFVFLRKFKFIDVHLIFAIYLLKAFNQKFSHYDWIKLSNLDLITLQSINEKFIPKNWKLPLNNLGVYLPFLLKSYLQILDPSSRILKNKSLRQYILLGQHKHRKWKKQQKNLKYKKIWKKK